MENMVHVSSGIYKGTWQQGSGNQPTAKHMHAKRRLHNASICISFRLFPLRPSACKTFWKQDYDTHSLPKVIGNITSITSHSRSDSGNHLSNCLMCTRTHPDRRTLSVLDCRCVHTHTHTHTVKLPLRFIETDRSSEHRASFSAFLAPPRFIN